MIAFFSFIILICAVIAILDWRKGIYACVVAALVQDPLRKLIPEEPVYLTVVAAAVLALAVVRAYSSGVSFSPRQIAGWRQGLATPVLLLVLWVLLQSLHSLIAYGNLMVTAVGLASYLAPVPALLVSYQLALRTGTRGVESWLRFYAVLAVLALSTVGFEYAGIESELFGQVGAGMKIYDLGAILIGKTGLFRSSEVAAWHATTAACFACIVLTSRKIDNRKIALAVAVVFLLIGIALLTGRRKSIVAIAIFATTYLFLFPILFKNAQNWRRGLLAVGATLFLLVGGLLEPEEQHFTATTPEYELFLQRGATVFEEVPDRFLNMSVGQAEWASRDVGLLGTGVGVGTSGARHFGSVGKQFGGWGEGGSGKIMGELGLPGLVLFSWLLLALGRHVWRILKYTARRSSQVFRLSSGLVAFLLANAMIFVVNTQIFSDFFVLIVVGLTFGFLLAMPRLAERMASNAPYGTPAASLKAAVQIR